MYVLFNPKKDAFGVCPFYLKRKLLVDFLFSFSLVLCHFGSFISYLKYFLNSLCFEKLVLVINLIKYIE